MKKGTAFLFMVATFVAGIVVGVVLTVFYEEKAPSRPPGMSSSPVASQPATPKPDLTEQINALLAILKDDPKNLKALIELGDVYFDSNQADKAIDAYTKALEIEPRNADVRTDLGIMYRKKGDFDRAIAEFKKAIQDNPDHVNSRYNLGIVLLHDKGDLKGALQAWEDFLKAEPSGPRADMIRERIAKIKEMIK